MRSLGRRSCQSNGDSGRSTSHAVCRTASRDAHWGERNAQGEEAAGGAYIVELRAESYRATRRIVIAP
ncbi:hypothetical protein CMK11_18045 [Candidatus Poribacteria bacterium]|nr:hypothetical protein [Candidatus Poribacteria bacterium]